MKIDLYHKFNKNVNKTKAIQKINEMQQSQDRMTLKVIVFHFGSNFQKKKVPNHYPEHYPHDMEC